MEQPAASDAEPSTDRIAEQAQPAERAAEEQFRRAIHDAPIPMIMQAEDGQVLQISRSWTELTGYTLADVPTFDAWLTRAYGDGAAAVRDHVHALFSGNRRTLDVTFAIRTRTDDVRHWSFSASAPGTLRDGRRFLVGMAQDITDRTRVEWSLAEQARLLDLSNDAIIVRDADNRVLYWNHGATELYGWTRDEAIGQDLHTLLRTEFEIPYPDLFAQLQQHDRMEGEVVQVTKAGRRLTVWSRWALDRDHAGRPGAILTTYNDITARKHAETAVQEAQARYHTLFVSMDQGYAVVDVLTDQSGRPNDFRYHEVNPAFAAQTGMRDVVGRTVTEILGTPNPRWAEIYGRVAETGEPVRFEEAEPALGRIFDQYVFRLGAEGSRRVAVLFTDITARKHAERVLHESEARQEFLLRLADALRPLANPVAIQGEACRLLGEWLAVDRAYYVAVDEAAGVARVERDWVRDTAPSLAGVHRVADFGWSVAILRRGECHVIVDTQHSPLVPPTERPAAAALQIIACMGAPLIKDGRLVGALCVTSPHPRAWTDQEVEMLRAVAERVWAAVERARAEAALRESEAQFRAVAEVVPDLLWSSDAHGRITWHNRRWYTYTGQAPADALGVGWLAALHPEDQTRAWATFQQAITTGEPLRQEHRIRRADGAYHWFLSQALPLRDAQGHVVRWYGAWADVHSERLALEAAEAALAAREQFLSIASHELRTPLTSLVGYAHMLPAALTHGSGDPIKMAGLIIRQTDRLNTLIEQLLDVSRLQRGQFAIDSAPVDLAALVRRVLAEVRTAQTPDTKHSIDHNDPDTAVMVVGDVLRLEQVVLNLIGNAIKYSPAGGPIRTRLTHTATEAVIEVEDAGIGVPQDAQVKVFDAFYRAQNTGLQISGFGLGLHVVHEIVERHGGRIEVDSTEGVGSTFRVVLPLAEPLRTAREPADPA